MRTGWGMNVRCVSTEWLQQTAEFQTHSDAVTTLPCKAIVADFDAINYIILYYIYICKYYEFLPKKDTLSMRRDDVAFYHSLLQVSD